MRNIRSNKIVLLILLLCFPTTILLGIISTNVHAAEYVPEEHLDNEWHWHFQSIALRLQPRQRG